MNSERQPSLDNVSGTPGDVGDLLRASRLRQGQELTDVAQALRIRAPYLQAIEDGVYDNLPGPAYAVGFIRTYANYLGLDGEQIVKRFKNEASGQGRRVDLNFPAAVPADGIPRGAVVTVGLLVLIAAYGGWYFLSSKDVFKTDTVPPVPETISRAADAPTSAVAAETRAPQPTPPVALVPPPVAPPAPAGTPSASAAVSTPAPAPLTAQPAPAPAPQAAATPSSDDDDDADSTPPPSAAAASVPAPARPAAVALAVPAQPAPDQAALDDRGGVDAPATGSQLAALSDATDDPTTRIVLKAELDSWIEVRDQDKRLLVTRLLRKGDSYTVPRREGLMLVTGNAGGLTITVGGESVPSLGPVGLVRRNVALDPQKLRAGQAVVE